VNDTADSRHSRIATRALSLVLGLALALAIAPAQARAQQPDARAQEAEVRAQEQLRPFQTLSESAASLRDSLVAFARAQLGKRYVRGGQSPEKGFDCSGLVKYVMAAFRLDLPRTARLQARTGVALGRDTTVLRPGDLLTFGRNKEGVSHIGIYIGDGHFIHASSVAGRVIESRVNRPPSKLIKPWKGSRRVLALDDSAGATVVVTESGPSST
jgi:cell wall-associated NlpC family hydrolase